MAERRPIYSAQTAGKQIGYIEGNEAFDLFNRPCAIYDSGTSLLRDPNHNAVVGYVSLADIFVGSSSMARELFSKSGPVPPQASLAELQDEDYDASVCGVEDDLFGTTSSGGANGHGTVFEIVKTAHGYASTPTTLVSFNGTNGDSPTGGLIANAHGDLFGTTRFGGANG